MHIDPIWFGFIGTACGIVFGYGVLQQKVAHLEKRVERREKDDEVHTKIRHDVTDRLARIETMLQSFMRASKQRQAPQPPTYI